jgi:phenylpropionate dioxygenase-like ring-hydroxylating dioxygenase large terminal subunit
VTQFSNDARGWQVVCLSSEIGKEAAQARVVDNRRLVVWRDGEGDVHVWDDCCPHRGAQLSTGLVSGGLLMCRSHGWRFDVNGQVVRPVSSTFCREASYASVYDALESEGVVWARFDSAVHARAIAPCTDA